MATAIEIFKAAVASTIANKTAEGSIINTDIAQRFYDAADLIVALIATGTILKGNATTSTNPGAVIGGRMWVTSTAGTYTNFGGLVVNANEIAFLVDNGTAYVKVPIPIDLSGYLTPASVVDNLTSTSTSAPVSANQARILASLIPVITYVPGNQLFNKASFVDSAYVNSSGAIVSGQSGYKYAEVSLDSSQTQLTVSGMVIGSLTKYYTFLDGSNAVISGSTTSITTASKTITIPSGAAKFRFTFKNAQDATTAGDSLMINYGATALAYEVYNIAVTKVNGIPIKNSDLALYSKSEVNALIPALTTASPGKNKANPAYILQGLVSSAANSGITANSTWRCIIIPVTAGNTYTISGWSTSRTEIGFYMNAVPAAGVFPTTSGNIITSGTASSQGLTKSGGVCTFTAPALCTYVAVTLRSNSEADTVYSSFQLEAGSAPTSYEAYNSDVVLKNVNTNVIGASYILVNGQLISTSNVALNGIGDLSEDEILLTLVPDNSANTTIEYYIQGKRIRQEVAPFRPLSADTSNVFDWRSTKIDGTEIHSQSDEAAPYRVFGTTIGANHGYSKNRLTIAAHGKTYEDVGSVWVDSAFKQWIIVGVPDGNNLDVSSRLDNAVYTGTSLSHVSGAIHTSTITGQTANTTLQMYPAFKNRKMRVYVDDAEITVVNKKIKARNTVTFAESYDIIEKGAIMSWLVTQVGSTTPISQFDGIASLSVSISYVFDKHGGCTIYTDFYALQNVSDFQDIMFVMANPLTISSTYPTRKVYVPLSKPFTHESVAYNFNTPTDITATTLATRIDFTPGRCESSGIYCDRVLELMPGVGFAIGYLPLLSANIGNRRTFASNKALQISESKKVYMSCIDGFATSLNGGSQYSAVCYKKYFFTDSSRTSKYTIFHNKYSYMYIDWHIDTVDRVSIPANLVGKNIVEVQSLNASILSKDSGSILFNVSGATGTGNYAFSILRFD